MRRPVAPSSVSDADVVHLRGRMGLFVSALLGIDALAWISDVVVPRLTDVPAVEYEGATLVVRVGSTVLLLAVLLWVRRSRPGRGGLVVADTAVTLGQSTVYAYIAAVMVEGVLAPFSPLFAVFGLVLLLGARAALLPSPAWRTVVLGAASVVVLFVLQRDRMAALAPQIQEGTWFVAVAYVALTTFTSRVIYGLRRQVREAVRLGQYTLEAKLGEGGMGSVYRARHAMLRRQAAIKLIKPGVVDRASDRERAIRRFEREADATASLRSPNTVELYDFGVSDAGEVYYVMELLDGIDLETLVRDHGPLPPARAVFLLRQVCDSLAEAHASDLVHRDVKPANVMTCRHGTRLDVIKVLDFGLVALGRDPESRLDVAGTPAYLAPELVASPDAVDARADLYAVGCVAFWLLTGQAPFERATVTETVRAHAEDAPVGPSEVVEVAIPAALDAVILRCLEKNPARRPPSAEDLAVALEESVDARWSPDDARRWWNAHRPMAAPARTEVSTERTVAITRRIR